MEIHNWKVKDIYFEEHERAKAESFARLMEKGGWTNEGESDGPRPEDKCIQLMKI